MLDKALRLGCPTRVSPNPKTRVFRAFSETRNPGFDSTKTRVFGKSHILAIFSQKSTYFVKKCDSFSFYFRTLDVFQDYYLHGIKSYLLLVFTQFFNSDYRSKTAILEMLYFEKEIVMSYCD